MPLALRRLLIWGPLAAVVVAALVNAFMPRPVTVDLATVGRGALTVTIDEQGETRIRDVYVVSAPVAGRLLRIKIEVGDPVVAGETVLATLREADPSLLDPRSESQARAEVRAAEATVALAQTEIKRARAELAFAVSELGRAKRLAARGNIAKRTLERAELEVATREAALGEAQAQVQVRRSELEMARAALIVAGRRGAKGRAAAPCCVEVRAPIDGRVLRVLHESEGIVAAGTPLVELGDPSNLEVVVELLSTDAVRVAKGARVMIEDWGGDGPLTGRVRRIEPYGFTKVSALGIEEQRVNTIVDFVDPPARWRRLGHGYRVETRIIVWQGDKVLKLPLGALFRDRDRWAVYRVIDGVARLRPITVGQRNEDEAEIVAGLDVGDSVVLHPSDRVTDGTSVIARD